MDKKNCTGSQRSEKNSESPAQSFEDLSQNLDHQLSPLSSNPDPDPAPSPGCDDECYDAVLLCCEDDTPRAEEIVDEMNTIKINDGINAKVELYELANTETEMFVQLEKILETCSYVFVLCTKNFEEDMTTRHLADECIMNSIMNKSYNQPWQVVPLVIQSENIKMLPMGLNSLSRIKWGNNHALTKVSKMLEKGAKRDLVRSQSLLLKMSSLGIQETSIQGENNDKPNSSSSSPGDSTSGIPIEHEDPYSMTTSPLPSPKRSQGEYGSQINMPVSSDSISAESDPSFTKPLEGNQPTEGSQDSISAESVPSFAKPLEGNQPIDGGQESMSAEFVPSFTKPLEGNQPTDGSQDSISAESAPSFAKPLEGNQITDGEQESISAESDPSFAKPLEGNQPTDVGQKSMSAESVPSSTRPLDQTQPATGVQENISASSIPSFTKPLEGDQPSDGGQDCISTSSIQFTEASLEEDSTSRELYNMSATSFHSTEQSMEEKSSSDGGQGSLLAKLSLTPSEGSSVDQCKEDTKQGWLPSCIIS